MPRKYAADWEGTLPGRIMIVTNEMPRLEDVSGALASRMLPLVFTQSFLGREDTTLTRDLMTELPGILNWGLDGLSRLRAAGRFTETAAAAEMLEEMARLSSPVRAFIDDRIETGPGFTSRPEDVWQAWTSWCYSQGRDRPGDLATLGRDLRAALPWLRTVRLCSGASGRERLYQAIRIRGT